MATSSGNLLGAQDAEQAQRAASGGGLVCAVLCIVQPALVFAFGRELPRIFTADAEVAALVQRIVSGHVTDKRPLLDID